MLTTLRAECSRLSCAVAKLEAQNDDLRHLFQGLNDEVVTRHLVVTPGPGMAAVEVTADDWAAYVHVTAPRGPLAYLRAGGDGAGVTAMNSFTDESAQASLSTIDCCDESPEEAIVSLRYGDVDRWMVDARGTNLHTIGDLSERVDKLAALLDGWTPLLARIALAEQWTEAGIPERVNHLEWVLEAIASLVHKSGPHSGDSLLSVEKPTGTPATWRVPAETLPGTLVRPWGEPLAPGAQPARDRLDDEESVLSGGAR